MSRSARAAPSLLLCLFGLFCLFVSVACASDRAVAPERVRSAELPAPTLALKQKLREALLPLPAEEHEPFLAYVARARAAFSADEDPEVQAAAALLPDDVRMLLAGPRGDIGTVLLGTWARAHRRSERVDALASLLRHRTVNAGDVAEPGRGPAFDAFEADLKARAERLGLTFDHVDHVAYEVRLNERRVPGARAKIGVLVHADVVPAEEPGWSVDPFAGVVQGERVIGRGALDDKGPLVAALFALAALKDSGAPLVHTPVLIVGTSEETHWDGIDRYQKARGLPSALFVADGAFPVGVGEKGISTIRLTANGAPAAPETAKGGPTAGAVASGAVLRALHGGEVANQVPASASARLGPVGQSAAELARALSEEAAAAEGMRLVVVQQGGDVVVRAQGVAAHGADPAAGHNALADLLRFLTREAGLVRTPCVALLEVVDERLGTTVSGERLGVPDAHPRFSPSTVNLGTARSDEQGGCTLALNVRWPPPRSAKDVVASVERALSDALAHHPGAPYTLRVEGGGLDPFLVEEDSAIIRGLVEAYEQVTGEDGAPVTLSGTTYAKAAPGSVTFGPGKRGEHNRIHAADEHITLGELDELAELYTVALARLAQGS